MSVVVVVVPSAETRRRVTTVFQGWAAWLARARVGVASSSVFGWRVTSRSAKTRRSSYQRGLSRPSPSMAAQEETGQQSLSCQTTVPAQRGQWERQCSMPAETARAWTTWVR